jgi:hypothetical protein
VLRIPEIKTYLDHTMYITNGKKFPLQGIRVKMSIRASISRIDILKFLCKEYESKLGIRSSKSRKDILKIPMQGIRVENEYKIE